MDKVIDFSVAPIDLSLIHDISLEFIVMSVALIILSGIARYNDAVFLDSSTGYIFQKNTMNENVFFQ